MRAAVAILAALTLACDSPVDVGFERPTGERFTPPANYDSLYAEMEACSGLTGDFSRVRWFVVPGVTGWTSSVTGERVLGQWWPPHDIYIGESLVGRSNAQERGVVTHEILHELTQDSAHPIPPFETCAPITV